MRTPYRCSVTLALAAAALAAACKPADLHGTVYVPPESAPAMHLAGSDGEFDLAGQRGKVVLVYFGYTHCPDVCPTTLADWHRIADSLGADARRVRFVFVSVDPARDDTASLRRYVTRFDPRILGVTGDSVRLDSIENAFHVSSSREASRSAAGYVVIHASQTFVIDPKGQLRLLYTFGVSPSDITADVRELIHGS